MLTHFCMGISETITAYHRSGMNNNTITDLTITINANIGIKDNIIADYRFSTDVNTAHNGTVSADSSTVFNMCGRINTCTLSNNRREITALYRFVKILREERYIHIWLIRIKNHYPRRKKMSF